MRYNQFIFSHSKCHTMMHNRNYQILIINFISDHIGSPCDATTIVNEFQLLFYRMGEHIAHHLDHCNRFKEENTDQVLADTSYAKTPLQIHKWTPEYWCNYNPTALNIYTQNEHEKCSTSSQQMDTCVPNLPHLLQQLQRKMQMQQAISWELHLLWIYLICSCS